MSNDAFDHRPVSQTGAAAAFSEHRVDDSSTHYGLEHFGPGDFFRRHRERVAIEHDEIGQLAGFERPGQSSWCNS